MQAPSEIINSLQSIAQQPRQDFLAALNVPNTLAANQLAQEKAAFYPMQTASEINARNMLASQAPSEIALRQAQAGNIPFEQQQKLLQTAMNIMRMRTMARTMNIDPDTLGLPDPQAILQGNLTGSMMQNQNMPQNIPQNVPPGIPQPSMAPLPMSQNQLATNGALTGGASTVTPDQANRLATNGIGQISDSGPVMSNMLGENNPENIMKAYHDNLANAQRQAQMYSIMGDPKSGQDILHNAQTGSEQQSSILHQDTKNLESGRVADLAGNNLLNDVNAYNNLLKNMTPDQFSLLKRGKFEAAFSGNYDVAQHIAQDMMINASHMYGLPAKMMTDTEMNQLRGAFGDPKQPLSGLQGNLRLITGLAQKAIINHRMMQDHYNTHYTTQTYLPWDGNVDNIPEHIRHELMAISPRSNDFNEPQ